MGSNLLPNDLRRELVKKNWFRFLKDIVYTVTLAFILTMVLRVFVVEARMVPTESMLPTIQVQDRLIVNKFIYHFRTPQRGEIVVFRPPEELHSKHDFVKRIIALPGDKVEIKKHQVYINDQPLQESYLYEPLNYDFGPVTVPPGSLLVLGDNRNCSFDSHLWNTWLTEDRVIGKAFAIYWPANRADLLK